MQGIEVETAVADAVTGGREIVMLAMSEPQELVTATVYVVVEVGVATGFGSVVLLHPTDGLHE